MKREDYHKKHNGLNISQSELDRKWRLYLREQEEMKLWEAAQRSATRATSTGAGGGGEAGGSPSLWIYFLKSDGHLNAIGIDDSTVRDLGVASPPVNNGYGLAASTNGESVWITRSATTSSETLVRVNTSDWSWSEEIFTYTGDTNYRRYALASSPDGSVWALLRNLSTPATTLPKLALFDFDTNTINDVCDIGVDLSWEPSALGYSRPGYLSAAGVDSTGDYRFVEFSITTGDVTPLFTRSGAVAVTAFSRRPGASTDWLIARIGGTGSIFELVDSGDTSTSWTADVASLKACIAWAASGADPQL